MKHFKADRPYLENKYHQINEPFNPYQRMAYHGYDFDESTGLSDEDIRAGLAEMKLDELPPIRWQKHGQWPTSWKIPASTQGSMTGLWDCGASTA